MQAPKAAMPATEPTPVIEATRALVQGLAGDARARGQALAERAAALNCVKLPVAERLEAFEALRGAALHALVDLDERLARVAQPLDVDARADLFLARKLAAAMSSGYRTAVAELPPPVQGKRRPPVAPALLQSIQFAADVLLASFRAHVRVPEGAWKDLHAIYAAAESHGVAMGAAEAGTHRSIADVYGETLLLAVLDPYRLAAGECDRVLAMLRRLRAPYVLTREPPVSRAGGHFLVAGDLDQPPRSAMLGDDEPGGPNWRFLDANPVVDRLTEAYQALEAGTPPPALAAWAADEARERIPRLMRLWADPPQRLMQRDSASGSVAICVGVKPIAQFVAHDAGVEDETTALRERLTMPLRALPEDESGRLIPIHEWNVENLSRGGMKVRRADPQAHPVTVGEVVGIRTPGKPLWTVGAVRWITAQDDGATEFGVQFFAEAACAVWMKAPSPATPPRLAILVTFADDEGAEALLAPAGAYSAGLEFEVRGEGLRYRARATEVVERTSHFDLFRIEPL